MSFVGNPYYTPDDEFINRLVEIIQKLLSKGTDYNATYYRVLKGNSPLVTQGTALDIIAGSSLRKDHMRILGAMLFNIGCKLTEPTLAASLQNQHWLQAYRTNIGCKLTEPLQAVISDPMACCSCHFRAEFYLLRKFPRLITCT